MRIVARTFLALSLVAFLSTPLHAGTMKTSTGEVLATLRQRIQDLTGYAVTIRHTKKSGGSLKQSLVRYELWGPSHNIRIRFLEGEKAGVEALYTASDHMVKVKFPHLPMPIFIDADELRGDRRIYETHLEAIIGQLDGPGWEATGLRVVDSADWPVWALTMVNRSLGQRVIIVVDRRQWLPTRIERFDATSSEAYEVWTFEDYRVDPPSITKASDKDHLASKG